jgi:hypothetical protein
VDGKPRLDSDFLFFNPFLNQKRQVTAYKLSGIPIKEASEGGGGDSRSPAYKERFGDICWELDALPPDVLRRLVRESIEPGSTVAMRLP